MRNCRCKREWFVSSTCRFYSMHKLGCLVIMQTVTYLILFVLYVAHKAVTNLEKFCLSDAQR